MKRCLDLARRLSEEVSRAARGCDCSLLSGGVDTTFVVASLRDRRGLTAFTVDLGGADAGYAVEAAERLGVGIHLVVRPSADKLLEAVRWVVATLRTVDPVEVAADAVHYLSLSAARRWGCSCVLSGDGGDELFAGYTFLLSMSPGEVRRWVEEMARGDAWLPTVAIGERLGVRVEAPLYSPAAREIALEAPVECLVGRGHGKLMLRLYLDSIGLGRLAWRPKAAVTEGSGSLRALSSIASRVRLLPPGELEKRLGFRPPSRLHHALMSMIVESGVEPPPKGDGLQCPVCGRPLKRGYCRFCGAYVSGGRLSMHLGEEA